MTEVLKIKHTESLIDSKWTKPQNWILSFLTGNLSKYQLGKILKRIDYWWIEFDSNDFTIKRKIGFDVLKRPLTGLINIELQIDFISLDKNYKIDPVLFNDLWNLYYKRDFKMLTQTHSKYLKFWRQPNNIEAPKFPCIIIDFKNTKEIIKVDTIEQLINQPDYIGYEWTDSERLIDSNGNVYKTDYINFGHPVGVVIPLKIERTLNNAQLSDILANNKTIFKIDN